MEDPRHRNVTFDASSVAKYASDYAAALKTVLENVSAEALSNACAVLLDAAVGKRRIFVVGNGGSAAIADHLCCDWTKGTSADGHDTLQTHSLNANMPLYSAIANDYGFENVFSTQIAFFGAPGDVLIAISSSGNSPNILNAVRSAKDRGLTVIGFSGFSGGELKAACDISIYAEIDNYGVVEDCHQAVMHVITQFIAGQRDRSS